MFERQVTGLLTQLLGSYVEASCFQHDKVNVGVWKGYVVLQNLELQRKMYPSLGVAVQRGVLGSVTIIIPWSRLISDSVLVTIDDVYVLLAPLDLNKKYKDLKDPEKIKKALVEQLYQESKKLMKEQQNQGGEDSFAVRMRNKIIDNLEFHVRRIHIRFQDEHTGDHPFTFGLAVESLHIQVISFIYILFCILLLDVLEH